MTYEKNNAVVRRDDDSEGIDLIDVVMQIWQSKWTVIIFIAFSLVIAITYLSTAKQKWTSSAIVTMPDAGQVANYATAIGVLRGSSDLKIFDIQQQVIERFGSSFSVLAETLRTQGDPGVLAIDSSVKGQPLPLRVTYQTSDPKEAQQKLTQYIQQVDEKVTTDLNKELLPEIKVRLRQLQSSLTSQESIAQEQKTLRLQQIAQALIIAKDANVTSPQLTQAQDLSQDTLFLLGSAALESMIKNEASRPLALTDDYYASRQNFLDVQRLKPDTANMHTYRYVMEPDLPLHQDAPKRTLILVIAVLLGAMVGVGFVLVRSLFTRVRLKPSTKNRATP